MKDLTIADETERCEEPGKSYGDEEAVAMCREFIELVKGFCEKYDAALVGELFFNKDKDTKGMLFVMEGAVPERSEVDRALAVMLTEVRHFYDEHEDAR